MSTFWFYYWKTHPLHISGFLTKSQVLILVEMFLMPRLMSLLTKENIQAMSDKTGVSHSSINICRKLFLKAGLIVKESRGDYILSEPMLDFQNKINALYKTNKLDEVEIKIKIKIK